VSVFFDPAQALEGINQKASPGPVADFAESLSAAFESTKLTDRMISKSQNLAQAYDELIEQLNEGQPADQAFFNPFTNNPLARGSIDTRGVPLALDAKSQARLNRLRLPRDDKINLIFDEVQKRRAADPAALPGFPATRAEFEAKVQADVAGRVAELDDTLSRTSTGGALGQFFGTAGALIGTEPLAVLTLPFGASARAGVLRTALLEATIAGGVETIIQPAVQAYRAELGLEAGADVAFENILMAMAGGGIFGGGIKAIAKALGPAGRAFERVAEMDTRAVAETFDELVPNATREQQAARDDLQLELDLEDNNPFAATPEGQSRHREGLQAAAARADSGVDRFSSRGAELPADDTQLHFGDFDQRLDGIEADLFGTAADKRLLTRDLLFDGTDDLGGPAVQVRRLSEVKARLDNDRALLAELDACA